ncbi:CobW family GTP-binding protein [Parathalassolituus penaei]|uniref:GTP-binding protein n=1 Tax=Parathalassolituus penaei TaxID=2997323 RepID=A0A9X3ISE9_9GAMM|nr:GTP-binding protein [Parathalassolituus penaei]MCY0966307.1 GTP-binding protein [Parathalassolituus penaei]
MTSSANVAGDNRIPVNVLTGFLGSGKTTLLKHWLRSPQLANTAVIINELGAVGLDHLLVDNASESLFLLDNGCLCCAVRDDLVQSLKSLYERRANGDVPAFERVVIETTGLADPLPVLQTLMMADGVVEHFRADAVVTCVDGVNGLETLERYPEAQRQVVVADLLLLTKQDLPEAATPALQTRLAELNPMARLLLVSAGQLDPQLLFDGSLGAAEQAVSQLLDDTTVASGHSGRVNSLVLVTMDPIDEIELRTWLEVVTSVHGDRLLRIKGLVQLRGLPQQPMLIHAVQQLVSPPELLAQWPSADTRSRIVLIGEGLDEDDIRRVFRTFTGARLQDLQQAPLALLGLSNLRLMQ